MSDVTQSDLEIVRDWIERADELCKITGGGSTLGLSLRRVLAAARAHLEHRCPETQMEMTRRICGDPSKVVSVGGTTTVADLLPAIAAESEYKHVPFRKVGTVTGEVKPEGEQSADRERFEERYSKSEGCWEWSGSIHHSGYGQFKFREGTWASHRVSWVLYRGEIPDGKHVLHKCDNRKCVNPDHLFLGTNRDNILDCNAKGRRNAPRGDTSTSSKLTEADVLSIRDRYHRTSHNESNARELAEEYGVTKSLIIQIVSGRLRGYVKENVDEQ